MTVTHAWTAVYRHFDDDALAALASVGLLRRAAKDVEADKVAVVALGESGGQLRADGQLVSLDAGGLVRARCDCPAPGICKHILAAALWLRAAPVQQASPPTDPLMEALALDPDALLKSAGTAAVRKAGALFADVGAVQVTVQGGTLIIALAQPEFTCRYVAGAGFAGMVSEAPESARATLHLLALAGLWRAHGQAFPWPVKPSLEAGDAGLAAAERQFLERLRALLLELSRSGWSHVNAITASQLRAFAMSARVESLPRVASLLRTLAAIAAALAARDTQADERLAIKLAARITALCDALAAARGGRLVALRGRGQRSFQAGEALDVLPLGAHWWEQPNGSRGLNLAFWDPAARAVLHASLARRDGADGAFSRISAWNAFKPWAGAGAASALNRAGVALSEPRLSDDGRISLSGDTRATMLPPWEDGDARWLEAGIDDWSGLRAAIRDGAGLCGAPLDYVLLKPAAIEAPVLDEAEQRLRWTLHDAAGSTLTLHVPCRSWQRDRIANLDAWCASGVQVAAVLARVVREVSTSMLEPVSLMTGERGALRSISLDYERPSTSAKAPLAARLARLLSVSPRPPAGQAPAAHLAVLDGLLDVLEAKAMTGRLHLLDAEAGTLTELLQRLRALGLDTIATQLTRYLSAPSAAEALRIVNLCHTCAELDTGFLA